MSHEHVAHGAHGAACRQQPDQLEIERLPEACGPVIRCKGQLTLQTARVLQQEVDRLAPMGHPVITINLSGIDFIDVDGVMMLLEDYRRLRREGGRLALVAGEPFPLRLLQIIGIDRLLPVFPREDVAALALRGAGPRPPAPEDWEAARQGTLRRWQAVGQALLLHPEEALRLATSMTGFCDLSEELFAERWEAADSRCRYCPLFQALGGRRGDLGCRSVLEPIIDAVRAGSTEEARARIDSLTRLIAELPVPEGAEPPLPTGPPRGAAAANDGAGEHVSRTVGTAA